MLLCRRAPIEFVKIEMKRYSGLYVAISALPPPVTCQLRSNWSRPRRIGCLEAVYSLFYQQPLECTAKRFVDSHDVHMQLVF